MARQGELSRPDHGRWVTVGGDGRHGGEQGQKQQQNVGGNAAAVPCPNANDAVCFGRRPMPGKADVGRMQQGATCLRLLRRTTLLCVGTSPHNDPSLRECVKCAAAAVCPVRARLPTVLQRKSSRAITSQPKDRRNDILLRRLGQHANHPGDGEHRSTCLAQLQDRLRSPRRRGRLPVLAWPRMLAG